MFGKRISFLVSGERIYIKFKNRNVVIRVVTKNIINIFCGLEREDNISHAIEGDKVQDTKFTVNDVGSYMSIQTENIEVRVFDDFKVDFYDKNGSILCEDYREKREYEESVSHESLILASQEGHEISLLDKRHSIEIVKTMFGDESFYGLGDKMGYLNKRNFEYEMWNSNIPAPHVESFKSLYKSITFLITLRLNSVFGIFYDNHCKTHFNLGKENNKYYYIAADDGNLDYYFIYGEDMKQVVSGYTYLTGTVPLPQMWTLGYQQSRWSYENETEVNEIADKLRELHIPCDAIYLDIDHMDKFKVFTWDRTRFSDPKGMIERLHEKGFKVIPIVDPAIKVEKGYYIFDEGMENDYFLKKTNGEVYVNRVWPGKCVYPDYSSKKTREWWEEKQKVLLETGVDGIWTDMNEPSTFDGQMPDDVIFNNDGNVTTHKEMHNLYGNQMALATYNGLRNYSENRPFVITRACFSGIQKYSINWTGDNQSIWAHLQMSIAQICNMGLSGIGYTGADIGGYGGNCTKELLCRWIQVGCFYPLFRNHSSRPSCHQEPWRFDEETVEIYKKYVDLRYELMPYMYDLFRIMEQQGLPIIRPLVLQFHKDICVNNINDQFMVGDNMLVAPIIEPGITNRLVYLPEGKWVDYWSGEVESGNQYIVKSAKLDECPIYIKYNSMIPKYEKQQYVGEKNQKKLKLIVYGTEATYIHYQDNGRNFEYQIGAYNEYKFVVDEHGDLQKYFLHKGYGVEYTEYEVEILQQKEKVNKSE